MSDLRPYDSYRDSGVPWLGPVPAHWQRALGGAVLQPKCVKNRGMIESTVLSLSYGRIVVKPPEKLHGLVPESFETYQIVDPGDIIIRPTDLQNDWNTIRVGLAHDRGIITSAYICFHARPPLTPEYAHLLLLGYDFKKVFYGMGSGLRQNLDWSDFRRLPILIPPPDEQQAIVRSIRDVDSRINRFIRNRRRLIEVLNEQKQAIIHRAVTRGLDDSAPLKPSGIDWLGKIPEHWEVKRLKWVTRLQRGYDLPQQERLPGSYPVISSGGIIDRHNDFRAKAPGVVMGRYGSTDAVFFVDEDYWPHNTSLFVTDYQGNDPKWIYYLLRSISKADHSGKSAVPGIDRKDLFDIFVAHPPVAEQRAIVDAIERDGRAFDEAIAAAEREIALIREYRTRLIADVVTGKLDVRKAITAPANAAHTVPKPAISPQLAVAALDAEIIARFNTSGQLHRVKRHKATCLAYHHARLELIKPTFVRDAAGPRDLDLVDAANHEGEHQQWFREIERQGRYHYETLPKIGTHKDVLGELWGDRLHRIEEVLRFLERKPRQRCENIATLYMAWNDLLIWRREATDDSIVDEVIRHWPGKAVILEAAWRAELRDLRNSPLQPSGFGVPTRDRGLFDGELP